MKLISQLVVSLTIFVSINGNAENKVSGTISTEGIASKYYSSIAKISVTEATARAQSEIQGKVLELALESEDGFLVYSVEIQTADKKKYEVLVDAGNGKVLEVEDEG